MMGYGYGMMGGLGMIIFLILIGLVIFLVVRYFSGSNRNNRPHGTGNEALDVLNQRYAKGEISEEEYVQKKRILKD